VNGKNGEVESSGSPSNRARLTGPLTLPTVKSGSMSSASYDTESGPDPRDWLAAIIAGSDDAIISKDLAGNIQSWNAAAARLFGYGADEVIGRPITILIPEDRLDEEPQILAAIRRGERVDHFETQRRRKDGLLIDLSLTISPIRNSGGVIVGASKIARDITQRRQAEESQRLLLHEMQHRIKNLFALTAGIVSLSGGTGMSSEDVVHTIRERLNALARAHDLTMADLGDAEFADRATSLSALLDAILRPYEDQTLIMASADMEVSNKALSNIALLLHELATNAAKYGCLSTPEGRLVVRVEEHADDLVLTWTETGGPKVVRPQTTGFGSRLENGLVLALSARVERDWRAEGLVVVIRMPKNFSPT
jgi:PAS domain S-box-containing protein